MRPVCWNIITQIVKKYVRDTLIPTILLKNAYIYIYICFASFASLYLYVPDEGSLLPKYRDCTTSKDFQLYNIYIYIYTIYIYI